MSVAGEKLLILNKSKTPFRLSGGVGVFEMRIFMLDPGDRLRLPGPAAGLTLQTVDSGFLVRVIFTKSPRTPKKHSMKTSKILLTFAASVSLLAVGSANAAGLFYSFDQNKNGSGDETTGFTLGVTAIDGFASATPVTFVGSSLRTQADGGEASFVSFEGGTPWLGSGGSSTPGHSLAWNAGSTGNTFRFTLNTTGTQDLMIRLAVRSTGSGVGPAAFTSVTYDNGTGGPQTISPTLYSGFTSGTGAFSVWTADLSTLTAVNNQASVTFQWTIPTLNSNTSFRVDNIQLTAVPEPSTYALLGLGLAAAVIVGRRRRTARQ